MAIPISGAPIVPKTVQSSIESPEAKRQTPIPPAAADRPGQQSKLETQPAIGHWDRFLDSKRRMAAVEQPAGPAQKSLGAATAAILNAHDCRPGLADRAKAQLGAIDLNSPADRETPRVDTRDPAQMAEVPEQVRASHAFYFANVEANDWGNASILKREVDGESVWQVAVTTDGDDTWSELFSKDGEPLASGRKWADNPTIWDGEFGASRSATIYD